tara:strand:- start:239 stop:502 length:264 start_codon:yes stop_codon:yes gene_type:complete
MANDVFTVQVISNKQTGLLIAMSDELPGLFVHGRSEEEIDERVPQAIKALLEAKGETVGAIVPLEEKRLSPAFSQPLKHFQREMMAA